MQEYISSVVPLLPVMGLGVLFALGYTMFRVGGAKVKQSDPGRKRIIDG